MERLTIRSKNSDMVWFKDAENGNAHLEPCEMTVHHNRMALDKLATYEDAEEQGRLVKLPCNRGDKIYFIKSAFSMAHFPIEAKMTRICGVDCDNDVMYSSITEYNKIDRRFKSSDIGKTVFLTKSEAEAKLKELRGGENESSN